MSVEDDRRRYYAAAHGMQTGVEYKRQYDPTETSPKHLRVGVNSAMIDTAVLFKLLIAKGIITEEELYTALADQMEEERNKYQEELTRRFGLNITLG